MDRPIVQWGRWLILSKCQIFGGTFSQLQTRSDFDQSWPKGGDCDNAEFDFDDQLKLQMQEEDAVIIEEINHG